MKKHSKVKAPVLDFDSLRNKQIVVVEDGLGDPDLNGFCNGRDEVRSHNMALRDGAVQEMLQQAAGNQQQA